MSLLMVRKSAPAKAADAHIDDITYKYKVGDKIKTPDGVGTVQKKTHTNSGKPAYEVKLDKGGVVVYFEQSVSAAHDSAPKFRLGQEVIVKTKYTEPYRARIVGLLDMSKNGPYDEQGYLIKNIKGGGVESMPEHALSLANAKDAQDANGDEVIAQKNGYKLVHNTKNDGYWFYTKSGAGWGITATNKVAAVNEFNRLVDSAKDAADANKSEELEREIKGDVVAVVSGNAARVSKDVPFATAKEGVESFARKNGVSVVASQEYGEAYKFKFSAAIDCAADSASGAAQDRGNYATNTIALLRMALGNIRTADSVVRRVISNIGDAMDKVKDEKAKSSLKSMQQEWWACEREILAVLEEIERVSVPSGVGVPNKQKLSPEDRKFIEEFFE